MREGESEESSSTSSTEVNASSSHQSKMTYLEHLLGDIDQGGIDDIDGYVCIGGIGCIGGMCVWFPTTTTSKALAAE